RRRPRDGGRAGRRARPAGRPRHGGEHLAELRHEPPQRPPQGHPDVRPRRPVPPAGRPAGRDPRRPPRPRRGGAGAGAGARGPAALDGRQVVVVGQQKGHDTKENISRNFGMSHPSGYRKAMRMFDLADKFRLPVVCLIDTPGAYPGLAAEEQGQAWVIAACIQRMSRLEVPAVSVVIGEGGSGGALAIGVANRVLILENAIYSVISPESCAAILWRDAAEAPKAAEALKLTAKDLLAQGVVDRVVEEP